MAAPKGNQFWKSRELIGAPVGNQFWKLRSKHGRDRIFATPELLLEAAYEYFQWCIDNPLIEVDFRNTKNGLERIELPKMRAFTIEGLTCYLHVNKVYFNDFEDGLKGKRDELSKGFSEVITHVKGIIYRQKFEGAAAGLLNANIIARDLGLTESSETKHTGIPAPTNIIVSSKENADKLEKFLSNGPTAN